MNKSLLSVDVLGARAYIMLDIINDWSDPNPAEEVYISVILTRGVPFLHSLPFTLQLLITPES